LDGRVKQTQSKKQSKTVNKWKMERQDKQKQDSQQQIDKSMGRSTKWDGEVAAMELVKT
jgi:hypothetical protein